MSPDARLLGSEPKFAEPVARPTGAVLCTAAKLVSDPNNQRGAALLAAMLTVTLVASFAATALWQQWQAVEIETAERDRVQAAWVLTGALDWARLILREDGRSGDTDHLAEPWAVTLEEVRLSSFLAADKKNTASAIDNQLNVFLSGQIADMQSRLNVTNLVDAGKTSAPDLLAFTRLFNLLNLPQSELLTLTENLRLASDRSQAGRSGAAAFLLPQRLEQLAWLGLSAATISRLSLYACVLPVRTPVNLNTASAEVIYASIPDLEMAQAQRMVAERASSHFRNLKDAARFAGGTVGRIRAGRHSVASRFFEVRGRLRLEQTLIEERSLLQRDGVDIQTKWRDRASLGAGNAGRSPSLP